jgi:hypothetical protein
VGGNRRLRPGPRSILGSGTVTKTVTNPRLIGQVAKLLMCEDATHPDFFTHLVQYMDVKGYKLEAHQRGIGGTYLVLKKKEEGK